MQLADLCARLEAATALDVYPGVAAEGAVAPFVIYNIPSSIPLRDLDGSTGVMETIVRVDVYHESFGVVEGFQLLITQALDDWRDASLGVLSSSLEIKRNLSDITSDPALSRVQTEFRILHT